MKTDARVRYTKMRIREAFYKLLEKTPVSRISIRELCELAEINRATFYKHYMDIFDLMDQLEAEAMEHLREAIRPNLSCGQKDILTNILDNIREPQWKITLLCGPNGDPNFSAKISSVMYQEYMPIMTELLSLCTEAERRTVYHFIAGGSGSVIADWIAGGMDIPTAQLAEQLTKMCNGLIAEYKDMDARCGSGHP